MKSPAFTAFFILLLLLLFSVKVYAKGNAEKNENIENNENSVEIPAEKTAESEELINNEESKTSKQVIFTFNEGATASWLTRIIKQTDRSNFVMEDFLPGLYFKTELVYFNIFTPMVRIAAYYPLSSTFNDVPQFSKTPLHIGADLTTGLKFELFTFDYLRLNLGPAFHMFFLTSDRWTYLNMGAAAFMGVEVPIAKKWTILLNGFASFDNGNAGGNKLMEPFNITYQYQIDIGVRYSKRFANKTFIFPFNSRQSNERDTQVIVR